MLARMAQGDDTTVRVGRGTALDLHAIALDLSRQERRSVPLGEVLRRLVAAWNERQQTRTESTP